MLAPVLDGFPLELRHLVVSRGLQLVQSRFRPRVYCGGYLRRHRSPIQRQQRLIKPSRSSALWWRHTSLFVSSCHYLASTDGRKVINHAQWGPSRPCPVVSVPMGGPCDGLPVSIITLSPSIMTGKRSMPRGAGPTFFSPTRLYWEP